ncbi:MAG: sugar-binding protein [Saccharofermentanales bacterium]
MKKLVSFAMAIAVSFSLLTGVGIVKAEDPIVIPKASAPLFIADTEANVTLPSEQWEGVPSYQMDNLVNGTTSSTGTVQMMWDNEALYFYVVISDTTVNSQDTMSVLLSPLGEDYGANAGIYPGNFDIPSQGWIPGGAGGFQSQGGSLTLGSGCIWNARYVEADQKYYVCVKATLNDTMKALLVEGTQMGVDLIFHDGDNWNTRNSANNVRWFGTENNQGSTTAGMGAVTLGGEVFRLKEGVAGKGTVKVDLVKDAAWDLVPEYSLTRKMVYAADKPAITEDVKFRMMWDDLGMYFWVEAKDATPFVTVNGNPELNSLYMTDAVSFYLDLENTHTDAIQGFSGHTVGQWFLSGSKNYSGLLGGGTYQQPSTTLKAKATADGYIFETFIKWSANFVPSVDDVIGVDVCYTDNTDGSGRTGEIYWSCDDGLSFNNVNKYGDVTLADLGIVTDISIKPEEPTDGLDDATATDTAKDEFGSFLTKINWSEVEGAAYYNINIFEVADGTPAVYTFLRTQEFIEQLSDTIYSLDEGKTYAFQVTAFNSDDAQIGAFNLLDVEMLADEAVVTEGAENSEDNSPETSDNNQFIYFMMAAAAFAALIFAKKRQMAN